VDCEEHALQELLFFCGEWATGGGKWGSKSFCPSANTQTQTKTRTAASCFLSSPAHSLTHDVSQLKVKINSSALTEQRQKKKT
jgi:hypothetical protein